MRRAAIAIPRVARRGVATMLIAFAGVRYVANGSNCDVGRRQPDVRFAPESRHSSERSTCPFSAMSRYR